ncbi:MAG TPA: lytic transglycosylase domain-containing protein [Bryobacteraceae bacterium]
MRFCLILGLVSAAAFAASPVSSEARRGARVVSVVRADPRTGRLVRSLAPAESRAERQRDARAWAEAAASIDRYVAETAARYDVDPLLVRSVIQVESDGDPLAVSSKGAQGLMQLMPQTARRFAVKDSFDPAQNIDGGVRYLKYLLTRFGDRQTPEALALAAYNAGEGAVMKHGGVPPYPETTQYVRKVAKRWGDAKLAMGAKQQAAPAELAAYPQIEQYVDERGVLHVQTRTSP